MKFRYTMDEKRFNYLKSVRGGTPTCRTCGKTLELGDKVVSQRTHNSGGQRPIRHIPCAKKVGLI